MNVHRLFLVSLWLMSLFGMPLRAQEEMGESSSEESEETEESFGSGSV